MGMELIEQIKGAIDEDERWAIAASQPYEFADEGSIPTPGGSHWQWVTGENWDRIEPDPVTSEFVGEPGESCNLLSVETWPTTSRIDETRTSTRQQECIYANEIVEMNAAAAGHIIRHDPARVLRQVAAHRKILDDYETTYRALLDCTPVDEAERWHRTGQGYVWFKVINDLAMIYGIETGQ